MSMKKLLLCTVIGALFICEPAFAENIVVQSKTEDFEPGTTVHVCWRMVEPGNPFLVSGEFDCKSKIEAVKAPWGGGGINGDQLIGIVDRVKGDIKIKEVRIRSLSEGLKATDQSVNMMTVDKGDDEFYNSYVVKDNRGRFAVFLDIEPNK